MKARRLLRPFLLVAGLGASLSAQAVAIDIATHGTNPDGGDHNFNVVDSQVGGYGPLASLSFDLYEDGFVAPHVTYGVTGSYVGSGGKLDFVVVHAPEPIFGPDNYPQYTGVWTATGGTGTYVHATGTGTFTVAYHPGSPNPYPIPENTTFVGNVQVNPVPEPASLCALGVGAVAMVRRRAARK